MVRFLTGFLGRAALAILMVACASSVQAQSCNTEFCIVDLNSTLWLNNNTWGQDGTNGWSESVTRNSNTAWRTDFVWPPGPNPNGVKAYPSAVLGWHWGWRLSNTGLPTQLSANLNVNSNYGYSVTFGSGGVGNVAYDCWLHTQSNPLFESPSDELMIWVNSSGGAGPISQQPVISNISIGGATWNLHRGNIGWNVWSFVRTSNSGSGSINVKNFTDYLRNNHGLSASKYLTSVQFGTEIFRGTGNLNVTNYTCSVGGGGGGGTTYYKFRNIATSLYIDGMGSTNNGANCSQWSNSASFNQQWERVAVGSYVKLKNRATGLLIDGMGLTTNGANCGQWGDGSSNNQQWTESTVSGNYKFQNRTTGLYLDGMGRTTNGSILGQWSNSSSTNQSFARVNP